MPQAQVIDLGPDVYKRERNIGGFFSELSDAMKNRQDKSTIDNILQEYHQNRQDAQALPKLFNDLERSNVAPSKRLEIQQRLMEQEKLIIERDKALNTKAQSLKDNAKAEKDQKETEEILLAAGVDPEEATRKSKVLSPASARSFVSNMPISGQKYAEGREDTIRKYVDEAFEKGESAQETQFAIDEARKAIKGDVAGPGVQAMLKNNPYSQLYMGLTPDEAKLQAANKKLLEGTKGLFGPKPTEREIFLLLNSMLPSIGKTPEANEAGLGFIEKVNQMLLVKSEIVDKLTNGGATYVPDLERKVQSEMKPLVEALRGELMEANVKYNSEQNPSENQNSKSIKVKAPDGSLWNMTQQQIDAAKKQGVIFEPVK